MKYKKDEWLEECQRKLEVDLNLILNNKWFCILA